MTTDLHDFHALFLVFIGVPAIIVQYVQDDTVKMIDSILYHMHRSKVNGLQ